MSYRPRIKKLDYYEGGLDTRYLKLDASNDPLTGALDIVGSADDVQLLVKGYSTQTNNILEVQGSDDSLKLSVDNSGIITGGTYVNNAAAICELDLSGWTALYPAADFTFPNTGYLRITEHPVKGTNDIFFQAVPNNATGYGFLEAWKAAGMVVGTGGNSNPVILQVNRNPIATISTTGMAVTGLISSTTTGSIGTNLTVGADLTVGDFCIINGNDNITANPVGVGSNVGWKFGLYGTEYAIGIAGYNFAIRTGGWLGVFPTNPANNANATNPDTNASVSIGSNNDIRFGSDVKLYRSAANVLKTDDVFYFGDKAIFTQADGNEYIDSLNDGYMDYRATTAHRIGDGTNYTEIKSDGEISLHGTARVTKCIWIGANGIKAPGSKPATWVEDGLTGCWEFADAIEANQESVSGTVKIPEDMDRTVVPTFGIGWHANGVSPGDCKWQFEYLWISPNEDVTAAAQETITVTSTASATSDGLIVAEVSGIDLPSETDVAMFWKVTRLSADGADTISAVTHLRGNYFKYTSNKLGE